VYFDSHAHLERRFFGDGVDAAIARAEAAGVEAVVTIGAGADPAEMAEAADLAARHPRVWAAVGVHPHEADKAGEASFAAVERLLDAPRVVALGEIGLDWHYDFSSRDGQRRVFERQLAIAARRGVPVVIHCREAHADCLPMLAAAGLGPRPGVLHCFTGDAATARSYLDLGFLISIPGVVTFRNAGDLVEAVRVLPVEALLV
jgi:TatD DNase family protein